MKIVTRLLLILFLGIFLFALWKLWGMYRGYKGGEDEYEELKKYTEEIPEDDKKEKSPDKCPVKVNFKELRKINPDVVGWIYIDEQVSYPIVQTEDNEYYLHRTFEKKDNFSGAIFLDCQCIPPFDTDNSIVYGHNLKSGKMFGYLKRYYDTKYNKDANYKEHEKIWIITPEQDREYKVFAAREIDVNKDTDVYMIQFETVEEYGAWLDDCVKKSLYKTRTKPDSGTGTVTLSTCTSDTQAGRFVVQGTMVQSEEHIDR